MIDHMTFRVANLKQTRDFYAAALASLGYVITFEGEGNGQNIVGLGFPDNSHPEGMRVDTWFIEGSSPYNGHPVSTGTHLCWRAPSRAAVDAFYTAAIALGGKDNGSPGLRPHYHPNYYGAFVIDLDGNNVEACCHQP